MRRAIGVLLAICTLGMTFSACEMVGGKNSENNLISESSGIGNNGGTAFSKVEEERLNSAFGFVIPFVQNKAYTVEEYEGYNDDLMAYENGVAFLAEGVTQEECEQYVKNLKEDENYSFEYPQDGYFYFTRNGYFVKVKYTKEESGYRLGVYVYSYTFEENENSEESTSEENSSDEEQGIEPVAKGLKYEKHKDGSYSVIGFYGDEDGVVEIPDTYNGFPVRYIRGNAFYGQECITEVIVGDNVYSMEGNAFMHCYNLEKVTLGNSLELIDMQAFLGCEKLEEITIPASVTFIGNSVFRDCTRLKSIVLEDPNGWCTTSNLHKPFPVEDMSNPSTVAVYFTDTHAGKGWRKD